MAYAPAALRWLATEWDNAVGSAVFSGIVGDAAHTWGYHRAANEIPKSDYSRQLVGDRDVDGIDMFAADAIDMNMSRTDMILVTKRVYASWRDQNDPRLNYWREIIGTLDGVNVIYMDCQSGEQGTADDSHLWHMHCGGLRIHANNMDAMRALLSVVKGETVAQWQAGDDDMQQTEALAYPGNVKGRTVGQALVDVQNLRDWLIGVGAVFPQEPDSYPRPDSPLAVLVEAARRGPVQSAPVDVAALAAELAPHLTAAAEAAVRKVLGSLDGQ